MALQPSNRAYQTRMELLQTRATRESQPVPRKPEEPEVAAVPEIPMEEAFDSLTARELAQAREMKGVPALRAKAGLQDFDLTGDPRALFDTVAQSFGVVTGYD